MPPLHERTFARSLPRKRVWCREAIGMGLAYHCVYLNFYSYIILEIRQYPKVAGTSGMSYRAIGSVDLGLLSHFFNLGK